MSTGFCFHVLRCRRFLCQSAVDSLRCSRNYAAISKFRNGTLKSTNIAFLCDKYECKAIERARCSFAVGRQYSSDASSESIQNVEQTDVDPYRLVQDDLKVLCSNINQELATDLRHMFDISSYHFDGAGKYFRPMVVMLMAKACNIHTSNGLKHSVSLSGPQRMIAMIAEMIHTASLVHDDVIDTAETRRGKPTVQKLWGQKKAILTGDYILSAASVALARIGNEEVMKVVSQVLEDLVAGEFMQLGSKEQENERFNHYLKKTFKKTASLIAASCKAVSMLSQATENVIEVAFEYGKNIGIAFQLVDDLLDYISNEAIMGKPVSADLKLGLATAPVLYAAHQFPEINPMIMRRFSEPGDIQRALELVAKSDGVAHTLFLAKEHCKEAVRQVSQLTPSKERQALINITHRVINRLK